ncbi:hypothetical protein [Dyadobacter sp. NIV53]|uniref:hypothetical protein n=1 Tax=Dyadobacter sp. NIV53 TaxID=2861765 RepID=UPI001C872A02|nr:hypothetical protein [Dyadobacter sp. NIV53]
MSEKSLRNLSIAYLILPNILFFYNWTNLPIAIAGVITLIYLLIEDRKDKSFNGFRILKRKDVIIIGLTTLVLTFVSGINGYCYQTFDYWCHNTKFYELLSYSWPIRIPKNGPVISYYYGFYIIPALFSKVTGTINEASIFVWTWLGIAIGISWIYLVLNKKIVFVLLAVCIGDLPHVLKTVLYKLSVSLYAFGDFGIENWSNLENLLWVPNQVIPTLILGGMFMYILTRNLNFDLMVLPIALSFWWAVFPAFVCGFLLAVLIIRDWILTKFQLDWVRVFKKVVLPFLICLPVLIFFMSHAEAPISGFIWNFSSDISNTISEYAVNIGINAVLFLTAYFYFRKINLPSLEQFPFYLILALCIIFPIYRLGKVNDFLFRGMMPFLIIIGMYLFYPLATYRSKRTFGIIKNSWMAIPLVLLLATSSLIGITRVFRAATVNQYTAQMNPDKVTFRAIPYDAYTNIYEVLKEKWSQQEANQYLGKSDSFYEKYMAPKL